MHDTSSCPHCKQFPQEIFDLRMVLINEALDNSQWAIDSRERLKAVEVACWYSGPDGELDQEAEPSPQKQKKRGKSVNGKGVKRMRTNSQEQRQIDAIEFAKNLQNESPAQSLTGTSGIPEQSHEDVWKKSVNETLRALTLMMQAQMSQNKAPPVPPRPSSMTEASSSDQTIPKQRDLPKEPIPRKPKQHIATDAHGRQSQTLSKTYADFERLDSSQSDGEDVVQEVVFQTSDQEDPDMDPDVSEADLGRMEKRKMHLLSIPRIVPDLDIPQPDKKSHRLEMLNEKQRSNLMPFLTEMYDQISKVSVVRERRSKDPFQRLPKFYPTVEPAESGILQNRPVPRELLSYVHKDNLVKSGASGRIAKLVDTIPEGAKEHAAIQSFKQATGYIRLANNIEIDVEMCQTLIKSISSLSKDVDDMKGLPKGASSKMLQIAQKVRLLDKVVYDVQSSNADLVRSSLHQYQKSLVDRRNAWISAADLQQGTAAELRRADFPKPTHHDDPEMLDMFGCEGMAVLKENDEVQKQASLHSRSYSTPQHTWVPSMAKQYNHNQGRFRPGFKGGYRNQGNRGSFGGGPGYPHGGRGQNSFRRRPQGGRRPSNRGNRGKRQPFSHPSASNSKE
jgi:hypothetical protein